MFNKTRGDEPHKSSTFAREAPTASDAPKAAARSSRPAEGRPASLGPSISISGNLSGNEDLLIEGSVEGEVMVRDHMVTISPTGRVKADVYGRSICVEGRVDGNLVGDEQVVIRQSGRVRGNVTAPRVNLENGAKFKGSIDMQPTESTVGSAAEKPEGASKVKVAQQQQGRGRSGAAIAPDVARAGEIA